MKRDGALAVVTGATGFIGSALVRCLLDGGWSVVALARAESPNLARLPAHGSLTVVTGGLGELDGWLSGFGLPRAGSAFVHLAWAGVGGAYRNSTDQLANVGEAARCVTVAAERGFSRWIGVGSQAEYGPLDRVAAEGDPTLPTTVYGAAKLAAFHLTRTLGAALGIETTWARVFSVYGPGDSSSWFVPSLVRSLLDGTHMALTAGEQLWDYLYVGDAAAALVAMAESESVSPLYNLGSGTGVRIADVAEMVRDMVAPGARLGIGEIPYRPDQVMHLQADISRLSRDTGWYPRVALADGLRQTVAQLVAADRPVGG